MSGPAENTARPMDPRVHGWRLSKITFIVLGVLAGAVLIAVSFDPHGEVISPWVWGPCIFVVGLCGMFATVAGGKAREAAFVDAHSSVGTVVEVIEIPPSGDDNVRYVFHIEAGLPDGTILRRKLDMGGWPDSFSWIGRHIHFRHHTVTPDDVEDAFFGREEHRATVGEARR